MLTSPPRCGLVALFYLYCAHLSAIVQGGYTALHLAARYGTIEGLERLLEDLRVHLDAVTEVRPWRPSCHSPLAADISNVSCRTELQPRSLRCRI